MDAPPRSSGAGVSGLSHAAELASSTTLDGASTSYSDFYRKANTSFGSRGPSSPSGANDPLGVGISVADGLGNGWTHVIGTGPNGGYTAIAIDGAASGTGDGSGSASSADEGPSPRHAAAATPSPAVATTAVEPAEPQAQPAAPAAAAGAAAEGDTDAAEVSAALARAQAALARAETSLDDIQRLSSSYDAAALASLAAAAGPPSRLSRFLALARGVAAAGALAFAMLASHAFGLAVQWAGAVAGAALIAGWGLRKGALAPSGAAAAFMVGAGTLGSSLRFGATLIAFFFSSSKLTAYKEELKEGLEENSKKGGQRTWIQVLCNGLVPTVLAIAYGILAGCVDLPLGPPAAVATAAVDAVASAATDAVVATAAAAAEAAAAAAAAAPAAAAAVGPALEPWRAAALTALMGGFLGYYACCCGDTWASELGPLSADTPRLITNMRPVRRGTNGGVTLLGLSASIMGGMFVGLVFYLGGLLSPTLWIFEAQRTLAAAQWRLIPLGLVAGLAGSVLDSLLGATLQFSGYDPATGRIVGRPGPGVMRISGVPILDNNAVNAVSASVTAGLTALVALKTFGF
ncbi:hypothetical protein GPECTOR_43g963 [Gonium pectorale]|uniref:Transmembrane protein 19 n=1 Tax=Gonium pectorale TaxID=33097 RepID=A0A150G9J8_GONPE|nr:hypothetical protein GPECTOR_43g963 [Gonium pectorale]|eukprot:KXZ46526.1 hypothetical protein GPECTOR_43g963 [Gonium pectorale]